MNCSSCQHPNRDEAVFCESCGAGLARTCTQCQNELRAEARFCDACGTPVSRDAAAVSAASRDPRAYTPKYLANKILNSKKSLEGERKHVTVLFADLANYTPLGEMLDAEALHSLMDRCFQRIVPEVHRFEGTVNQFTGDGLMALFGAPIALEDAPRRAVCAALAIQRALTEIDREVRARYDVEFRMRIGVHTGPVVVGRIGDDLRMDYTAIGDTTNLASRLESHATPGSVWISEATRNLVSGFFDLTDVGLLDLKGKSKSVRAYQVESQRSVRGRIEAAGEDGLTPLVGRANELKTLSGAYDCARTGQGQVVYLVGEAGIGKSRLVYEFRRSLQDEAHVWLEGHCASLGQSAFLPLVDALQRRFGIKDGDDEATARGKLETGVREFGSVLEWTLPFLRQLMSLGDEDETLGAMHAVDRRSETTRALTALLLEMAEERPLVLVIEDLHWIDSDSEQLLGFISESIPSSKALFIFTHRPGYEHPFGDRSFHTRLAPKLLTGKETGSMTGALLAADELPPNLAKLIAQKSDGNPLFIEEVTKSLIDEGVLRFEHGRLRLERELDKISVPDSIQDVLMARIDRLEEEPRRAIQVASVIGREFALGLLDRIIEAGDRVGDLVGELRALELIYQKASHPELAFMFKHALTHDVAYESVLISRRKSLHEIVGLAIEELYRDRLSEHYAVLAQHFSLAESWEKSFLYHALAARKAADNFANDSAIEHCRAALDIAKREDVSVPKREVIELEGLLALVYFTISAFRQAGETYERAAALHEDDTGRAMNLALSSFAYFWAHDYDRNKESSAKAIELARASKNVAAESIATASYAQSCVAQGDLAPEHRNNSIHAFALAEQCGSPHAMMVAGATEALFLKHFGEFRAAIELSERALITARRSPFFLELPLWTLGLALAGAGEYGRAIAQFQSGIEMCNRIGQPAIKARLLNSVGWCFAEFGCHRQAAVFNRQSTDLAEVMVAREVVENAPELYANGKINLAGNLLHLGEIQEASDHLDAIRAQLDEPGDPWMRWRIAMHLEDSVARVALLRREPDLALAGTATEIEQARESGSRKIEARALELRGRVLANFDQNVEAEEALRESLAVALAIEHPPIIWRCHSLLALLANRAGRKRDAERSIEVIHATIEGCAKTLPSDELRNEFRSLRDRLISEPLAAYQ